MPLVTVSMYPGRTDKQKAEFARAVTDAATKILDTRESHVIVVFEENRRENWYQGGKEL